ncbi:enoyl-CoA hydratase/isomerase family protein [Thermodesulfobacteriota bacterium]
MGGKNIIFEKENGIAIITMSRPERLNAMSEGLMNEMREAIEDVKKDDDVRVLIITGAGRGFCSGADLKEMEERLEEPGNRPEETIWFGKRAVFLREGFSHRMCLSLMSLEKPVIAAVNGPAVGGGCDIALMCDIRIASERAVFGEFYVKRGIISDEGGIYLLPQAVGMSWACELLFTGDAVDAAQAERIGLVNRVVPHDKLLDAAKELAEKIVKRPPLAVQMAKRALYWKQRTTDFERNLQYAAGVSDILLQSEGHRDGVESFTKRKGS